MRCLQYEEMLMNWLQKIMSPRMRAQSSTNAKGKVPEGVWEKCAGCGTVFALKKK